MKRAEETGKLKQEVGTITRFLMAGAINTIIGCALMFVLYNLVGCNYWVSSMANYFVGCIISYMLNRKYTFRYDGDTIGSLLRFAINIVMCYFCAYGIAKPLAMELLGGFSVSVQENIAMAVGMVLFTAFNYIGQRFFAFRKKESNDEIR